MLSVTFKSVGPGLCAWCQKDKKEVFFVQCDIFTGTICWVDLRNAVRYKVTPATQPPKEEAKKP